ncbi:MAG: hypothetical protein M3R69_18170 [Acidobacteriota bacterium]|nr:hypothetical protein [Acidobacteriota bacterium]
MSWNNLSGVLAIVSLVLLLAFSADSKPRKTQRLATGTWGGQHIRVVIGSGSATIEYDCAHGIIAGPLTFNTNGNFTWKGSHSREHGGPTRIGEQYQGEPAVYSGSVKGDTMTLTVTLAKTNETIGTFMLTRGNPGKVFKCR